MTLKDLIKNLQNIFEIEGDLPLARNNLENNLILEDIGNELGGDS